MRNHFCTPKALLEALKKSTLEGEEPDSTIISLAGKPATKTGGKKKGLGVLQEQIYAKQAEIDNLTKVKDYVEAPANKPMFNANDAKTAQDYIEAIKKKQADKKALSPEETELLDLNGKLTGMKVQIASALSDTKKTTLEKRRFDYDTDAKRRVKLSDQTQKKLEALQAGGKELTNAEVYRSLLFDARSKNDAERLKEVRKEVKDLKADQTKVLNEKKDALLEKLKSDFASIANEELSILETNAEKKVRLDIEKAQKQEISLDIKTNLLKALKADSVPVDLMKKKFDAILKKANKTDLENKLLAVSKDLTKEKAKISQENANIVFDALNNKENLTKDEQTVLDAIVSKRAKELAEKLDTYTNLETTQKKRLEALNKPLKTNPAELEAQIERRKKLNVDLEKAYKEHYLKPSKIDAEANGKQALVEAYKANAFSDTEANKLADNQHAINMKKLDQGAYEAYLKNLLKDKVGVKDKQKAQSMVDRLLELARHNENGSITKEQFIKVITKYSKVSPDGLEFHIEERLRQLDSELEAVKGKNFDVEMRKQSEINYELATLMPATLGGQFSKAFNIATLGTLKSTEKDHIGGFLNTLIDSDAVNSPKKALEVTRKFFSPILDLGKASKGEGFYKLVKDAFDGTLNLDSEGLRLNSRKWKFDSPNHPVSKVLFPTMHFLERVLNVRLSAPDALWFTHMYDGKKEALVKQNNGKELTYEQHKQAFMDAERALLRDDNIYTQWVKNIQSEGNIASLAVWRMLLNKPIGVDDKKGTPIFFKRGKESVPEFGAGTLLNPFVKFSTNALLQAVHLSGVLPLKDIVVDTGKNTVKLVKNFNLKQAEKELMSWSDTQKSSATFAKKALPLHVAMAILGITGGYFGVITGGYSRKTKDVNEAEGTPEDSIIMGDLAVPYGQIFPLAPPLKAYSHIGRKLAGKEPPVWAEWNSIASGVDSLFTALNRGTENTIASSLETLIRESSTGGGANIIKGVVATGANAGVSFIPSIAKDTLNLFLPEKIETKGSDPLETLANKAGDKFKLGYLAGDKKAVKTDITGRPVNDADPNVGARVISYLFNAYGAKHVKLNPILRELAKISKESGEDVQLKQVDNSFEIGKELANSNGIEPQVMKLNASDFAKWQEMHNVAVYNAVKDVVKDHQLDGYETADKVAQIKKARDTANTNAKQAFLKRKLKKQ